MPISRRSMVAGSLAVTASLHFGQLAGAYDATAELAQLEASVKGRLGVAMLNVKTGRRIGYRADERFPMCSTFKLLLVAKILSRVDRGRDSLDGRIVLTKKDLIPSYAPIASKRIGPPGMTYRELCEAAAVYSDNIAANALLNNSGGSGGLTAWLRTIGDTTTRLDRMEPELNEGIPGDPRDTTTPLAMVEDARRIVLGNVLSNESRAMLTGWLAANPIGNKRLRGGFPNSWRSADKTGTGRKGTVNDVAIAWPPSGGPLIVSAYLTEAEASTEACEAVLARVGKLAAASFGNAL